MDPFGYWQPGGTFWLREHYRDELGIDEARGDTIDVAVTRDRHGNMVGQVIVDYTMHMDGPIHTITIRQVE